MADGKVLEELGTVVRVLSETVFQSLRIRAALYAAALVFFYILLGNAAFGFQHGALVASLICLPCLGVPVWLSATSSIYGALISSETAKPSGGTTSWEDPTLCMMDWVAPSAIRKAAPAQLEADCPTKNCLKLSAELTGSARLQEQ